jgi:hypothetical protein
MKEKNKMNESKKKKRIKTKRCPSNVRHIGIPIFWTCFALSWEVIWFSLSEGS